MSAMADLRSANCLRPGVTILAMSNDLSFAAQSTYHSAGVTATLPLPVRHSDLLRSLLTVKESQASSSIQDLIVCSLKPLHVLIAEDNPINRKVAEALLSKMGFTFRSVENGLQAVRAYEEEAFDLILMDLHMPELSGIDATIAIRSNEKRVGRHPLIFALTASALESDRDACFDAGMEEFLCKPFRREHLITCINRHMPEQLPIAA